MSNIKILIVEDVAVIAEDIYDYLIESGYDVTGIANNYETAINALKEDQPDIAILDINLGDNLDGFKIADYINTNYNIPFIYLTAYATKSIIEEAKYTRPMGYIVKPFDEYDLISSIEIALYNYAQLSKPKIFSVDKVNKELNVKLTETEFNILQEVFDGKNNQQIADAKNVSINTIKTHLRKIYIKLNVASRTEALALVFNIK